MKYVSVWEGSCLKRSDDESGAEEFEPKLQSLLPLGSPKPNGAGDEEVTGLFFKPGSRIFE